MPNLIDELKLSSSFDCLDSNERNVCPRCEKKRKYFCYDCFVLTNNRPELIPSVQLPVDLTM